MKNHHEKTFRERKTLLPSILNSCLTMRGKPWKITRAKDIVIYAMQADGWCEPWFTIK